MLQADFTHLGVFVRHLSIWTFFVFNFCFVYILRDGLLSVAVATIRHDTRCYFNVRSKADISQLNLPHGTDK